MAQQVNKLSAVTVLRLVEPGMYPDGGGLYLQVKSASARSWVYRYMIAGKARWAGLGSAQTLSLAAARQARDAERQKIRSGVDPIAEKQAEKAAAEAATVKVVTFADW